jgi:hypothetical protein
MSLGEVAEQGLQLGSHANQLGEKLSTFHRFVNGSTLRGKKDGSASGEHCPPEAAPGLYGN